MKASTQGFQKPSDMQGKPVPLPGIYHVMITHVNDSRQTKKGEPMTATVFEMEVLTGSRRAKRASSSHTSLIWTTTAKRRPTMSRRPASWRGVLASSAATSKPKLPLPTWRIPRWW